MTFKKLPVAEKIHRGCGTCSTASPLLSMERMLMVGFGNCNATKDGRSVYDEQEIEDESNPPAAQYLEDMAKKDPDHDWRVSFYTPLHDEEYQRQGDDHWVCIESGPGFA